MFGVNIKEMFELPPPTCSHGFSFFGIPEPASSSHINFWGVSLGFKKLTSGNQKARLDTTNLENIMGI